MERFVDTSGWAEWADRTLLFHAQAVTAFDEVWNQGGRFLTTNLILIELTALLTSPLRMSKSQQIQLLDDLRREPSVEIVPRANQRPGNSGNPGTIKNGLWWTAPVSWLCSNGA
jgi:predicted nucleic acid-binding protein